MAVIPAIAPIFGGWLGVRFGSRIIFVVMALLTALFLACLAMTLRETNAHMRSDALKPGVLSLTYLSFFRHRAYMGYMLANALIFGGLLGGAGWMVVARG